VRVRLKRVTLASIKYPLNKKLYKFLHYTYAKRHVLLCCVYFGCKKEYICETKRKNLKVPVMKKTLHSIFFAAAVVLCSCTDRNSTNLEAFDRLQPVIEKDSVPIMQIAYLQDNKVYTAELYNPNIYSESKIDSLKRHAGESVFQAASLSKVVFAYMVNKMADASEIDLDKPLYEYTDIKRFTDSVNAQKITARMVLEHRTGLPNWSESPSSKEWPESPIEFKFAPDSCFGYSGEGFAFLQRAVESIKGKEIEQIAKEMVFEPLGMKNSSYIWQPKYDSLAVDGYNWRLENRGVGNMPRANVAYTLRTTAADYMKFLQELIANKKAGAIAQMFEPYPTSAVRYAGEPRSCDSTIFWGLGIGINKIAWNGIDGVAEDSYAYWHWGDNGNFKALFIILPDNSAFVYFTNSAHGHVIANDVTEILVERRFDIEPWINN